MSLTAPYSEVSSAIYNLFLLELLQYIGNMFKKSLSVNDAWFGFYSHFKKGTLHVHMNNFKISRQKYSTNMATGRCVTSRENDLLVIIDHLPQSYHAWITTHYK